MTREEAAELRVGDLIYVPKQLNSDWPESYNCLFGNTYKITSIGRDSVEIKSDACGHYDLYFSEIERTAPEDLGDDFDGYDIKLLFGGDD